MINNGKIIYSPLKGIPATKVGRDAIGRKVIEIKGGRHRKGECEEVLIEDYIKMILDADI